MQENKEKVFLNVYDITMGMAKQFSPIFLGKQIEGLWHTGVIVFGKEYYWGGIIQQDIPGKTPYGKPLKTIEIGETFVPEELFRDFISEISSRYDLTTYNILKNNCNNFSQEVVQFLTGKNIPSDILNLPEEILNTPFGNMIKPLIEQFENSIKTQFLLGNQQHPI